MSRPIHAWDIGPVTFQATINFERKAHLARNADVNVGDVIELHLVNEHGRLGMYCVVRATNVQPIGEAANRTSMVSYEPHEVVMTGVNSRQWVFVTAVVPPPSMLGSPS